MTGMPSSVAFLTAGRIASESFARTMSTLAPFEIRLSTSASCLVGDPCASAEMYFAPALSSTALIAASSVFQRSSWKFDQETPTVMSFAIAANDVTLTEASKAAPSASVFNDFIGFLPWVPRTRRPRETHARPSSRSRTIPRTAQWSAPGRLSTRQIDRVYSTMGRAVRAWRPQTPVLSRLRACRAGPACENDAAPRATLGPAAGEMGGP